MTHYAWSNFPVYDEEGKLSKQVKVGEEVTAGDLNLEDAEFDSLVASGVIREQEYPAPEGYSGSAVDYAREQLVALTTDEFVPLAGSMPNTPQQNEWAQAAIEASGYDPSKPPEEQPAVEEDAGQASEEDNEKKVEESKQVLGQTPATGTLGTTPTEPPNPNPLGSTPS